MTFNLEKYLTENNLTIISKIREDVGEDETGPSKADLKKTDKDFKQFYKDKAEYDKLKKDLKKILSKYTVKQSDGSLKFKVKDKTKKPGVIAQYKKDVGNIPQDIKRLQQKLKPFENPETDTNEEPME